MKKGSLFHRRFGFFFLTRSASAHKITKSRTSITAAAKLCVQRELARHRAQALHNDGRWAVAQRQEEGAGGCAGGHGEGLALHATHDTEAAARLAKEEAPAT